jgi:hypothetical protein
MPREIRNAAGKPTSRVSLWRLERDASTPSPRKDENKQEKTSS